MKYEIKLTIDGAADTSQTTSGVLETAPIKESQTVAQNAMDTLLTLPDETELLLEVTMKDDNNVRVGGIIADGKKGVAVAIINAINAANAVTE